MLLLLLLLLGVLRSSPSIHTSSYRQTNETNLKDDLSPPDYTYQFRDYFGSYLLSFVHPTSQNHWSSCILLKSLVYMASGLNPGSLSSPRLRPRAATTMQPTTTSTLSSRRSSQIMAPSVAASLPSTHTAAIPTVSDQTNSMSTPGKPITMQTKKAGEQLD